MPDAMEVRPGRWANITVLYDDGWYSAIWGKFPAPDRKTFSALGVRWNGGPHEKGFPNSSGYPSWYVEPDFLIIPILQGLRQKLTQQTPSDQQKKYLARIEYVLVERAP